MENMERLIRQYVKIGKTSITIKDDDGKTRGIIRNIQKFTDMPSRYQFEHSKSMRKNGFWGTGLIDNVVFLDKKCYFLLNLRVMEFYEKIFANAENLTSEYYIHDLKKFELLKSIAEKQTDEYTVIPCYFL